MRTSVREQVSMSVSFVFIVYVDSNKVGDDVYRLLVYFTKEVLTVVNEYSFLKHLIEYIRLDNNYGLIL